MHERLRLNCALMLALSILLQPFASHCYSEIFKDTSSNAEDSRNVVEEQQNRLDPAIEQIFRGPSDRGDYVADPKRSIESESSKASAQSEEIDKHARVKRESIAKRRDAKSSREIPKSNQRRSLSRTSGVSSRSSRSSKDLPLLPEKDYEIPVDADKFEYLDEPEDDSSASSKVKENRYRGSEFRVGEDSERYIDQEERSSLYDDFEAKDVVKRGISGAEDYEEVDEEDEGYVDDAAELEERGTLDEEVERRKVHGDVRVKREHENFKEMERAEVAGKVENTKTSSDSSGDLRDAETSLKREVGNDKDSGAVESKGKRVEKDIGEQGEQQSKRNVGEKIEIDVLKENPDRLADISRQSLQIGADQTEMESNGNARLENPESQETTGNRKEQEIGLSIDERAPNDLFNEPSNAKGPSKLDESKIADISTMEAAKVDVPTNNLDSAPTDETGKLENSKGDGVTGEQLDGGYEKRVEKQIQRKIDSIKEEIKREIAENRRVREIEENNARFDELRDQEEEDEEVPEAADPSEKRDNLSKRSLENSGKVQARDGPEKQPIKRRKRQGDSGPEKSTGESDSRKKVRRGTARKRSVGKSEQQSSSLNDLPRKREYPREVFLVKRDRNGGKKKRRRRSKNSVLVPEQRSGKLEDNSATDFASDSNLRGEFVGGKSSLAKKSESEKAVAEGDALVEKKFGSVASLTGSNEDMGPLATEYGEAFGGLHGEPGVALARFKRIKRVLRPSGSKA